MRGSLSAGAPGPRGTNRARRTRQSYGIQNDLCLISFGTPSGWEAAVFDHYQAVVTAICAKLQRGPRAAPDDAVGGSTYGFNVWKGHPHYDEAMALLARLRAEAMKLREKVTAYNADNAAPEGASVRVLSYMLYGVAGCIRPDHAGKQCTQCGPLGCSRLETVCVRPCTTSMDCIGSPAGSVCIASVCRAPDSFCPF